MKHILALCLLIPSLLIAVAAQAAEATITCTGPTKYEDGTAIPTGTVITYSIYGALQGQPKTKRDTAATCSFRRPNLEAGVQEWYVTATAGGLESAPSAITSLTVKPLDTDGDGVPDASDACPTVKGTLPNGCNPSPPAPPTSVISTTVTAYEYRPSTKTFAAIGLVPEGVTCGPQTITSGAKTYCRVKLGDSLPVVWPQDHSLREVWVVRPAG